MKSILGVTKESFKDQGQLLAFWYMNLAMSCGPSNRKRQMYYQ